MTLPKVIKEWFYNPATAQDHLLKITEREYTEGDLLAEEKIYDANAQYCYSHCYEYNVRRELTRQIDALGIETIYDYDDNGNKIYEQKIGSQKRTFYTYDKANRLIEEKEEHGTGVFLTTTHAYDPMGNRVSTIDHFGQETTFQYDSASREISQTDPLDYTEYKEYDTLGHITTQIDKEGYVTKTINNLYGLPLEIQYPDGTTKRFAYNLQGHLIQEWERDGISTIYEVDYQGRPKSLRIYGSDGNFLKYIQRNYKGPNLSSEIDAMGNAITYQYDGAGRLISKTRSHTTTYEYDSLGRLAKTTTPDAVEIKHHDFLDRLTEERTEDHSGNVFKKAQYAYDINGNCTQKRVFVDLNTFSETTTIYNSQNEPILEIDPLGNQSSIIYHYTDHLEKETIDPLSRRKLEVYDALSRLQSVQNEANGQLLSHSSFTYDGRGDLIHQKEKSLFQGQDFGVYSISTTYDGMRQKTSETEQEQKTTLYTYRQGRLHTITKPDNVVLTHTYDALGRLQDLTSSEGTINYCYIYDRNDNLLSAQDLINHTTTLRSYDPLNRINHEQLGTGYALTYSYDTLDRLKEVEFFDGYITYQYTPTSLQSASRYRNNQVQYTYSQATNLRGKITHCHLPNGEHLSYQWDPNGRCKNIYSSFYTQELTYDPLGNLISTTIHDPIGHYQTVYTYDELNQITQELGPFTNQYAHDSLNNRRSKDGNPCSIDCLNQLTHDSTFAYTYDLNGRRTAKNQAAYSYDALGRLLSYDNITYQYDPFGRRISRNGETTTHYLYLFDTEIGAMENGLLKEFRTVYNHATLAIELHGTTYSPIRNHRGDICVLLDQTPAATYRYDAFGLFFHQGTIQSPWLFSGQRYDVISQLYHFLKREYDPILGRWITPDPLGFADGPNLYAYVHNNPLIYVDPYGLITMDFAKGAGVSLACGIGSGIALRTMIAGTSVICPPLGAALALGATCYSMGSLLYENKDAIQHFGSTVWNQGVSAGCKEVKSGIYNKIDNFSQLSDYQKGAYCGMGIAALIPGRASKKTPTASKCTNTPKIDGVKKLDLDMLSKAGQAPDRGGLTRAGRALDKHGNRPGSPFPKATGDLKSKNMQGQHQLDDILTDPSQFVKPHGNQGYKVYSSDGRGAFFQKDGRLRGFVELRYE